MVVQVHLRGFILGKIAHIAENMMLNGLRMIILEDHITILVIDLNMMLKCGVIGNFKI